MCENFEKKNSFEDGVNIYKMVLPPYITSNIKTVIIVFTELPLWTYVISQIVGSNVIFVKGSELKYFLQCIFL